MDHPMYGLYIVVSNLRVTAHKVYSLRIIRDQRRTTNLALVGEIGVYHPRTESNLDGLEEIVIHLEPEELKIVGEHLVRTAEYLLENKA